MQRLIVGKENKGTILTLTERLTGSLIMRKLPEGKNAKALAGELFYMLLPYKQAVLSITSDNGTEFYEHQTIAKTLNTLFFFANPYSSWQRGLNEYTNGLIRQYIPKKQTFNKYNDQQIIAIDPVACAKQRTAQTVCQIGIPRTEKRSSHRRRSCTAPETLRFSVVHNVIGAGLI